MRVALDCTPLLTPRTGIGVFCHELVHALAARDDVEVAAFAMTWRGRGRLADHVPPGIDVRRRPMPAGALKALWRRADHPRLEWWVPGCDVVHGPNFVVPPSRRAAEVVTVHDLGPLHFPDLVSPDARRFPDLLQRAVHRGAWVHTDSSFVAAEVVDRFGADPARVRAIHPGVVAPAEGPGTAAADGEALAGGDRYLLALGSVEPRKNLPDLVRAFDRLARDDRALRLVIAGPEGQDSERLRDTCAASIYGDRIVRLAWVDDRQRTALLRGALAFVYPSRYEGFGFPPLEAQTIGTSVITTAAGSLPEVVGDGALLLDATEGDALVAAVVDAVTAIGSDQTLRRDLAARGTRNVARFSWLVCTDQIVELYRQAVAAR